MRDTAFMTDFDAWLDDAFRDGAPDGVAAYCFNLFETGDADQPFGVELVGASSFDADDSDWPCDEVWAPRVRMLPVPLAAGGDWKACLASMRELVASNLASTTSVSTLLKAGRGVAIGFVDGDLDLLWVR